MVSERIQRRIETLLGEADQAVAEGDWARVRERSKDVLALDPSNADALAFLAAAERRLDPTSSESDAPKQPQSPTLAANEPERRQLSVLFCDLVGSTELSGRLDPEDLRELVQAYQAACSEVVARHDGHIAQYLGDGILVYFGYPVAHEDDPQRAVRAALEIVAAIQQLNEPMEAENESRLAVRVGVHTGPVVVGEIGGGTHREHLAMGETPNIASRLQGLAEANGIIVSSATFRLVAGYFEVKSLGSQALKGVANELELFRVLGETGIASRLDADPNLTPFVGREPELAVLESRWRQAKQGGMQAVLISGEPGIGKSRLLRRLREQVAGEQHIGIELACSQLHQSSALFPVIQHLQRVIEGGGDSADARAARLEELLSLDDLDVDTVLPLFLPLLSLPLPAGYRLPALSPELQRQRTIEALVSWLLADGKRQPVLCFIEDLHWADPSTLELISLLLSEPREAKLLLVLTFRPEFSPRWTMTDYLSEINLDRLARKQAEEFVTGVLGGKPVADAVLDQIVGRADGIPLFVEELTKMVLESGQLEESAEGYRLQGKLPQLAIPDTLQDSLMARLDRLPTARPVAQVGSVLGRDFSYPLLRSVSGLREDSLKPALSQLVEAGLLYQRERPPLAQYSFKHALIQDAAYQSLLRSARRLLHERTARVLEEQFPAVAAAQPELLAQHFSAGGQAGEAVNYWRKAGALAAQRGNHAEAMRHYSNGIELLMSLNEGPERDAIELALYNGLGGSTAMSMGYAAPEVVQVYEKAHEIANRLGETSTAVDHLAGLWSYSLVRAEHGASRRLAEQWVKIGQATRQPNLLAEGFGILGWSLYPLGEFEAAREAFEECLFHYRPLRHQSRQFHVPLQDIGASANALLTNAFQVMGYPDQALRCCTEALQMVEDPHLWLPEFTRSGVLSQISMLYLLRAEFESALQYAARTLQLSQEHGFPVWMCTGLMQLGAAKSALGETEEGLAMLQQGVEAWRAGGARTFLGFWMAALAEAHRANGDLPSALRVVNEALDLTDGLEERFYSAELYRLQGKFLLELDPNAVDAAAIAFERALDLAERQGAKLFELRAAMGLHRLRQGERRSEESRRRLAVVCGWFTEGLDTADLREARSLLASI